MSAVTAKVIVNGRTEQRNAAGEVDTVTLQFNADYSDGRNKEWAKYTPGLSITMGVKPEVAEHFPMGQAFTLTFEAE